ncbi:hypothetical protein AB0D74_29680 [Streptomyces sp. NPDC048278]|uniref:hypothetical protein n=1 Tax=Streptomyces sp. NPDC048278 TaxID=3155809 RepID=UPI003422C6B1
MDGPARMWISAIPSLDPDTREVVLDLDQTSGDSAERMARMLLNRGHEGEEGVFYLLPEDLAARYERTGNRLAVSLLARRDVLAQELAAHPAALRAHLDRLPRDPLDDGRVVLVRRETVTDFVPAERDGFQQPVLLIDHSVGHSDGPVALPELVSLFERQEAGVVVVAAPRAAQD